MKDKNKEIWKDIKGYEGVYQISNLGNVKSIGRKIIHASGFYTKKSKIRKLKINNKGYLEIALFNNKKIEYWLLHRLLYITFLGELIPKMVIDHIDNDPLNNKLSNLQQITYHENNSKDKWKYNLSSKYIGVTIKNNKFIATIKIKGISYHIGVLGTEKEAFLAKKNYQLNNNL